MEYLFINNVRTGYAPNQIESTMTVSELIDYLQEFDGDRKVLISNDGGYTYSPINEESFIED